MREIVAKIRIQIVQHFASDEYTEVHSDTLQVHLKAEGSAVPKILLCVCGSRP